MSTIVHARKTKDGMRYRLWDKHAERYVTGELTEKELCSRLLKTAIQKAKAEIGAQIVLAKEQGVACHPAQLYLSKRQGVEAPW